MSPHKKKQACNLSIINYSAQQMTKSFLSVWLSLFIVPDSVWHVSTDHDEFFHTPKVRDISYHRRRTPKHSLSHLPHSVSIIDTWLSCWKASQTFRWSVWWIFQLTNRPPDTPHQNNVVGEGLLPLVMHIQLQSYFYSKSFIQCLFTFISVSFLWVSSFMLTVKYAQICFCRDGIWIHSIISYFTWMHF